MTRKLMILLLVYAGIIALYAVLRPAPVDWTETYYRDDKIPFGTYVLFNEFNSILNAPSIEVIDRPLYSFFRNNPDDTTRALYVAITPMFRPDHLDTERMLDLVRGGSDLFVSAEFYSSNFLTLLGLEREPMSIGNLGWEALQDSMTHELTLVNLPDKSWNIPLVASRSSFVTADTVASDSVRVLGHSQTHSNAFLEVPLGDGTLYLHTVPAVFSNYFMLDTEYDLSSYASAVLSHLPEGEDVRWLEYYTTGGNASRSPFQVLGRYPGFRWAYWTGLVAVLIFFLFTARRKQRAIPVLAPVRNTSLDYVHTIGDLYYRRGSHIDLAKKRIRYFREYLQEQYRLTVTDFNESEAIQAAIKTGRDEELIKPLFSRIQKVSGTNSITEDQLVQLDKYLDRFYKIQ